MKTSPENTGKTPPLDTSKRSSEDVWYFV